jgi:hypothetical protein
MRKHKQAKTNNHKVAVSVTDEVIGFFNLHNSFSRIMALGSRPAREADNLTAICEPIV